MDNTSMKHLKAAYVEAQRRFGNMLPHLVLACAGGSDEHWQIWNSEELYYAGFHDEEKREVFPVFVIDPESGQLLPHPDGSAAK